MLDYNPILPDIQNITRKHLHLLHSSPQIKEIFPCWSIFPAYRRTKNLKEILAPSKLRSTSSRNQRAEEGGCSKCGKQCDLCNNFLLQASKFQSAATGRQYPIEQNLSCSSKNVIYLATCNKCNVQYVGSTSTEFKDRFCNHKSCCMLNNKGTCELEVHYNSSEHDISQISFIVIKKIRSFQNPLHLDQLLLTREAYWTTQLFTLNPHGLKHGASL